MDYITLGIIITAAISIVLVMIQDRSSGVGGAFGGGDVGGAYQKRRGAEKMIFVLTIVFITAFAGLSLWNIIANPIETTFNAPQVDIGDVQIEGTTEDGTPVNIQVEEAPVE